MIAVIAQLGIADLLKDSPKDVEDLAQVTHTHAPSLYRLLRAVASLGIFAEDDRRRFRLTALAEPLQRDVPGSLHAMATFAGEFWRWQAWGHLRQSIQTGETAFQHTHGMGWFAYLAQHPEASAVFDAAMASSERHQTVVAAYDFSTIRTLVDVGGGTGKLLATILQAHPHLQGVLYDTPQVTARAHELLHAAGVADRCAVVAGDFFAGIPSGGDAYLLSLIIHDWDDAPALSLLENCHRAMPAHGKLLVIEQVVPSGNAPSPSKLLDITMLVEAGGRERTETEFRALFAAAGFTLTKIVPTRAPECVLEGIRVEQAGESSSGT
jgi:hypothetical protein